MIPLIKAAINHKGFAFLNVVSPCVTFNNNVGSTKSYDFFRDHTAATSSMDFIPKKEQIEAEYKKGEKALITLHDGSVIHLDKLAKDWDPTDRDSARTAMTSAQNKGNIPTGLIYLDPESEDLHEILNTTKVGLNKLTEKELCPGSDVLDTINASLR